MLGAADLLSDEFSVANALAVLLTTESLLFAAMSLAYSASGSGGTRLRTLPISGAKFAAIIAATIIIVAAGALATWADVFLGGDRLHLTGVAVAFALLTAIVMQPVLVVLLAFGFKEHE